MSTPSKSKTLDDILHEFSQHRKLMQDELQKVIVGQTDVIEQLFAALWDMWRDHNHAKFDTTTEAVQ